MKAVRPDDSYYQGERRELLPYIPMLGDRLLDVGCSEGGFAAMLKRECGYKEIWGMEYDESSAAIASKVLDRVILGDASICLEQLPDGYFNLICLNDVIEHLIWPEMFLAGLKPKLAHDARIFCSIPNLRQYRLLWNLLQSQDFEYTDSGLLDRTHLRFFTRRTMLSLLDRAGFEPTSVIGWGTTKSWKFKILNALTLWRGKDMMHSHFFILAKLK